MKSITVCALVGAVVTLLSCSEEPDKLVASTTSDGAFSVSLEAEKNWVYEEHLLPIKVVVTSLAGPVSESLSDEVQLVANNGTVSDSRLTVSMNGPDEDGEGAESVYEKWVTFKAAKGLGSEFQGEIHALFRDVMTTLKIRIADPPPSD